MKANLLISTMLIVVAVVAMDAWAGSGISVLAFQPVPPPVPEPLTILGVCAGVGAVSAYVRKRIRDDRNRQA